MSESKRPIIAGVVEMDIPRTTHQQKGFNRRSGRFFEKRGVAIARNVYRLNLAQYKPNKAMRNAVHVALTFTLKRPKTSKRQKPTVRPDVDNMAKLPLDVMTSLGFWEDDSQITRLELKKEYTEGDEAFVFEIYADE